MAYFEAITFTIMVSYLCANIARNSCCSLAQINIAITSFIQAIIYLILFFGVYKKKCLLLKLSIVTIFLRIIIITTLLFVIGFISIISMIVQNSTGKQLKRVIFCNF